MRADMKTRYLKVTVGDISIPVDQMRLLRMVERVKEDGRYSSRWMNQKDLSSNYPPVRWVTTFPQFPLRNKKGLIYSYELEDFGITLEMWEKNLPLNIDFYLMFGRGWKLSFLWNRGSRNWRDDIPALNGFGEIVEFQISGYDSFKRDWSLMIMFDDDTSVND